MFKSFADYFWVGGGCFLVKTPISKLDRTLTDNSQKENFSKIGNCPASLVMKLLFNLLYYLVIFILIFFNNIVYFTRGNHLLFHLENIIKLEE